MKRNPLSVWTFSYRKSYYLTHPWKFFNDIYWNCRNFWHRGRYGYAYTDVWNFCDWYPRVAAEALRYMAKHGSGYPGVAPWETPEKWRDHLEYLANQLQRCSDSQSFSWGRERNEYWEEYSKDVFHANAELRKNYLRREEEIAQADHQYQEEVFKFLGSNLQRYWD